MRVMRENPTRFQAAVMCAMQEQNLRKRFDLRTGRSSGRTDEPMDVDLIRPKRCFRCSKTGHLAKNCRVHVNAVQQTPQLIPPLMANAYGNAPQYPVRTRERMSFPPITCWNCNRKGHMRRKLPHMERRTIPQKQHNK